MKHAFPLLLALGVGCVTEEDAPEAGGSTPGGRTCEDEVAVPLDDSMTPSPGFSFAPQRVVDSVRRAFVGEFFWTQGWTSSGQLDASDSGRDVRAIYPADSSDGVMSLECPPYYAIDLAAALSDADLVLEETFSSELRIAAEDSARFTMEIAASELRGSLDLATDESLVIAASFDGDGWTGTLHCDTAGSLEELASFTFY